MSKRLGYTSQIVHHDFEQAQQHGQVHSPVYNSVPYGYEKAEDLIAVFQGKASGHAYARQSTPTMNNLQHLMAQMDGGINSLCFSTGMAAVSAAMLALLKMGDHIICSRFLFGNTVSFLHTLKQFGIEVEFVDTTDVENIKTAYKNSTRLVFVESIANPGTQISDLSAIGDFCQQHQCLFILDNTLTTSYLLQPKSVKAHLCITSLSKYICGHGTVLGGAITDTGLYDWRQYPNIFANYRQGDSQHWGLTQIKKKALRDIGGSLSSDNAYQIAIGYETIALRMDRACYSAMQLALMLQSHSAVNKVYYPGLENHPQHDRAAQLFKHFGALISFDLEEHCDVLSFLDALQVVINATHLGDNRTLALPMAQTIFYEMGAQARAMIGIGNKMIRVSIGIEDTADVLEDFRQALAKSCKQSSSAI